MTMLFRRGPRGHRPIGPMMRMTRSRAADRAASRGANGARWAGRTRRGAVGSRPARGDRGAPRRSTSTRRARRSTMRCRGELRDLRKATSAAAAQAGAVTSACGEHWRRSRAGVVAVAALPSDAWAWTPGTHIFLGEAVLRSLQPAAGRRRRAAARPFRTTSSTARSRPTRASRRSTRRPAATAIRGTSGSRSTSARATSRCARSRSATSRTSRPTPSRTTTSCRGSSRSRRRTAALGHSYWESRFETHLGERYSRRARELILLDHGRVGRASRPHPEPDDLQHADQPPDLPRHGVRRRTRSRGSASSS